MAMFGAGQTQTHGQCTFADSPIIFDAAHIIQIQHYGVPQTHCTGGQPRIGVQTACVQIFATPNGRPKNKNAAISPEPM